ncbi:MAG: GEVED domain-containing protein, partial [Verrucomicrobia bacterium]|nr:GEVED domain-containing protein [Verrucomicrobiota bacterium]
ASSATVVTTNLSGAAAYLNAWIDFNNNGSFTDVGEQIATNTLVANGTNGVAQTINFTVPAAAIPGQRGMRVRFSDVQNPTSVGAAGMGEVEDNLLTINCPTITLSPTTVPNGTVAAAYSQTITAAGGTGPYSYAVSAGALPSGLALSAGGVLSGTLTSASVANFTLRATDANGCTGIRAYTFTPVCLPISIAPSSATQGLINTAYTQTLTASGGTAPYGSWTVTAGALPTGLTLNAATGVISGTPTVAASPATNITVRTTDAYGCQGTQVISLQICPVVTLSPASFAAALVGTAYSQTISGSGGTAPYTFTLSSGSLPAWASLDASTGVFSGMPNSATAANFFIRATDANGCSGTRAYSLSPACPVINIAPASVTAAFINTAYSQIMTPSAGTAPFVFTVASGALPTGLALDSSTGVISGTPTASTTATFTIRATDTYGCVGTSASYSLTPAPSIDFGDLSTLVSASSIRDTTVKMGALVDYEYTQTANATATGDDITGSDDEDGVTLPVGLIQGQTGLSVTVNVTNTSGAETYLNGWIDFNNNGVLTDAGEQIVFNEPIATGTSAANRSLTFNVPSVAAVATVGVRFRLTSIPNPGSTGASGAGEVEDYRIGIAEPEDHGDFTLFQDASSKLSSALKMGDFTDAEFTAFNNLAATGDDLNNVNDEDGTTVQAVMVRGQAGVTVTINLTNLSGSPAYLNGYADFNNNGALTDTDEQILTNIVVPTGTTSDYQTFFFDVPATATLGNIGMRFRLTSVSNPGPVGVGGIGEVEDYTSTIVAPSSNFRDYFYTIRRDSSNNYYLDEISVYNPASTTPSVSVVQNILNLSAVTPGFNSSASNAYMNGLALDWLNRRFYWNSTSGDSSKYNFQLNTAYYDNVTKTWSSQAVTGSNLSNIPLNTGSPISSGADSGAFPRAAYYAGDYYTGGQRNSNMVAWRLNSAGTGLMTPAFNEYSNFFHLTQTFGGGDFVIRPQDGFLVTSTAVNDNTTTLFTQFMSAGFNPSGAPAASVVIDAQIPRSAAGGVQIAGVGGVTRMYAVGSTNAKVYRLDNYDTNAPVAVTVGNLPSATNYPDLSEGISSSVLSLGVKGIVYEDTNGLTNSTVDGIGSNAGGTLFAMLVDGAGNLVDSFPVKDDGTFILGGAAANTAYTVVISTSSGSLGGAAPVADLPTGWINTGEFLGSGAGSDGTVNGRLAVSIVNNGLVNAKFGISQTVSMGNLVWNDANNNGLKDTTESGISGVTVQLWTPGSDNAIGGTGLAADTMVASTTTTGAGIYAFTSQLQGKYFICVIPPTLYSFASSTAVNLDNGLDNDNNGSQPGGRSTAVYSPVIDLAVGKEPGNLASGGIDIDNTIDFGLLTALDFGDYSLFGSASSTLITNLFVGTLIDAEYAATTDVTATGDNLTGLNDEDGATIPVAGVVQGAAGSMTVRVTNLSGSSAFMNVWIDYNNNGVLTDAGEQVAANTLIANGTSNATRTVNFTAPATAFIGNVGVRVRLTSTNSPGSVGSSGNGEVEDHLIEIQSPIDYGDFASFASAGSTMVNTIFIGTLVDTEPSSTSNAAATADDLDGTDDEDGATVPANMTQGAPGTITVNVTNNSAGNARLSTWIDFNRNGVLTDAGEQIANNVVVNKSTIGANQVINFTVPVNASVGTAGIRVRLTDTNNPSSVGLAGSGEVEDYVTSIVLPTTDFGDWNAAADASSLFSANLRIGTLTDTEFVSTRNATATGDDTTGSDDEDGVTLAASYTPVVAGSATVVTTNTSGAAAYLNAWIDYNNNGSFADAGEQIATNTLVATGTSGVGQTINFTPPITAIPGQRGARFRFTSVTNPTPVGAAGSGEVEDAMVTINCPVITITTAAPLAVPTVGASYSQTIAAIGGSGALVYSVNPGTLPAGLSIAGATGIISGTPTNTTSQTFTIRATDINGCFGLQAYTLTALPNTDFGDWNGAGAQTTVATSLFNGNLRLGATVDAENTATTNATATGDDITNSGSADDEDGVTMPASITPGASVSIPVSVFNNNTAGRQLQAWIDFDNNGSFNNVDIATAGGERIYNAAVPANAAQQTVNINFTAPMPVSIGTQRGARFRFSDSAATTPTSSGANGEIEDYVVSIICPAISLTPTLPSAYLGTAYSQTITASGGRAAYIYTLQSGALPTGLSLGSSGAITGTPTASGSFNCTVLATDANGCTTTLAYTISVLTFSVGNLIFEDSNNNGLKGGSEPGVPGALVQLFNPGSDNAIGGTAGAADAQVGSNIITTSTGAYLFSGLASGNYYIRVTPPAIYTLTGGTPATADNNVDNNNDGAQPGGAGTPLFSPVFNLAGGAESITDGDTDTETNLTIDFGLWTPMGVGNLVFIDLNGNGNYDDSEGLENVYVQIFAQGANVTTDSPVGVAFSDHKGRYFIDNLNPGNYFLHLPASQFASGGPLFGMITLTSVVAGDDNIGQDLLNATTPATTGASTAVFTLTVGTEPTGASEPGFEGNVDDAFIDSNYDFTLDLGLRSPAGVGFPLAERNRNSTVMMVAQDSAASAVTAAATFSTWKTTHADTDADFYPQLLEYALDTDPTDGRSGAGKVTLESSITGNADALFTRPASGRADIRYDLEVSTGLTTWSKLTATPQLSIGSDGRQIVRYPAIQNAPAFAGSMSGFVRLKVSLDADLNGTAEDTATSPVLMFSRETFPVGQRSFSMPLMKGELFVGNVTSSGSTLTLPVAVTLSGESFIEDLSTGSIHEINEAASTSTQITLTDSPTTSLTRIALRAHHTLASL